MRISGLLGAVAVLTLATAATTRTPALAQEESWRTVLRLQLEQSHNCTLQEVLFVREVPVGKEVSLEGRVRCADQREFDFSRERSHQKYDIRLCQPTVC